MRTLAMILNRKFCVDKLLIIQLRLFTDKCKQLKELEVIRITTKNEKLLKTTKASNDEHLFVQLKKGEMNSPLNDAAVQRHFKQTKNGMSKGNVIQAEKEPAVENPKGLPIVNQLANFKLFFPKNPFSPVQTKQLQEKETKLDRIISKYEQLLREKEHTDYELSMFKRINRDMNERLSQATKECDLAIAKISGLSEKIESLQIERENIRDVLKGKFCLISY